MSALELAVEEYRQAEQALAEARKKMAQARDDVDAANDRARDAYKKLW